MSEHFDIWEDDPVEQSMKAYIAGYYYDRMRAERDRARALAARLEEENDRIKRVVESFDDVDEIQLILAAIEDGGEA